MTAETKEQPEPKQEQQSQSRLVLVVSGVLLAGIILSYFLIPDFQQFADTAIEVLTSDDQERIKQWVDDFGFWGPVFIVVAMVAQMFLIVIPTVVLMVVSTLAYGPLWGSLISLVAVLVASSIAYYIGWHAGHSLVDRLIGQKTEEKVNHYIQTYGTWAIVLFRVSPFLSNDAISFVAGIGKMRYPKFLGATTVGIVPLIGMIAYVGQDMQTLENSMLWLSAITAVGIAGYWGYRKMRR